MKVRSSIIQDGVLIAGDILALALVTVVGFARHGTLTTAGARLFTTFIPLVAAWLVVAPAMGLFVQGRIVDWRQLWRVLWAMLIAAPLAAFLRGIWLNSAILPVFVLVLGGVSALGMLAWRGLWALVLYRKR
jgi:hypothetical protein